MSLALWWLVADMDGTVLPTPHSAGGRYVPLNDSPAFLPLVAWLQRGGNLAIVSTAGRRMLRQVHAPLLDTLQHPGCGRLLLCGFSGAGLVANSGRGMLPVCGYADALCMSETEAEEVLSILTNAVHVYVSVLAANPHVIDALSSKYHEPLRRLLEERRVLGDDVFNCTVLTAAHLTERGRFLRETGDAIIDRQLLGELSTGDVTDRRVAQYCVSGIPLRHFDLAIPAAVREVLAEKYQLECRAQPNSVVVARQHVDKSAFVEFLRDARHRTNSDGNLDRFPTGLDHVVALGDCPESVDRPLTLYPEMVFISAARAKDVDASRADNVVYVGDEERGVARFLQQLLVELPSYTPEPFEMRQRIDVAASTSRQSL